MPPDNWLICAASVSYILCMLPVAFKAQLSDRRFQAGFKAWLGATIALVVIAAAYTQLNFLGVSPGHGLHAICCPSA
jgi:hypothetical protein